MDAETNSGAEPSQEARDQRSEVGDQRSEVGDQRSEVGDQKSEVGGQEAANETNVADSVKEVRAMMAAPLPPITSASVRVMRSHDYCHFEVVLGVQGEPFFPGSVHRAELRVEDVDAVRKAAARLVDKAVEQFKVAKERYNVRMSRDYERARVHKEAAKVEAEVPEGERTPKQKALIKCAQDDAYWSRRGHYDYEDDFQDEYEDWRDEDDGV